MDRIARIELEGSKKSVEVNLENIELQKNRLKYSYPYDKIYLKLFYDEVLEIISLNSYSYLIFLGGGQEMSVHTFVAT